MPHPAHWRQNLATATPTQSTPDLTRPPPIDQWAHFQTILLTNQNTAYPTPRPSGNMIHGRHRGVSLNFQAKTPTARMPNMMPMILGSITCYSGLTFFNNRGEVFNSNLTLTAPTASTLSTPDHDRIRHPSNIFVCGSMLPLPLK